MEEGKEGGRQGMERSREGGKEGGMIILSHAWLIGGTRYFLSFHPFLQREEKSLPPSAPALSPNWEFLKT